jgi:hypothetical protein
MNRTNNRPILPPLVVRYSHAPSSDTPSFPRRRESSPPRDLDSRPTPSRGQALRGSDGVFRGPGPFPLQREPSTLQREPSIRQREPSTLQREPSPLQREPSPLQREPSTSQREPSTLQREPSPLQREPSTCQREPSIWRYERRRSRYERGNVRCGASDQSSTSPIIIW